MKVNLTTLIAALILPSATSSCTTFGLNGGCDSAEAHLSAGVEAAMDDDPVSKAFYDGFLGPLFRLYEKSRGSDTTICYGDFPSNQLQTDSGAVALGCDKIPLDQGTFGAFGVTFPITYSTQLALVPLMMWTTATSETVSPAFCIATQSPTCSGGGFTFGVTLNSDTLVALSEISNLGPFDQLLAVVGKVM